MRRLRHAVLGTDPDLSDPRVLDRVTVGVLAAWIAMGGDLLGSCVYGPDVLGRASGGHRGVLVVAGLATLATLAVLALAYTRMVVHFPHGGGGYTAARYAAGERAALVSGVALVLDAGFNVAVSVVTCVEAAAAVLPAGWAAMRLPAALALVALLAIVNLRGVKESVALLAPILLAFVGSHLLVLGAALAQRAGAIPDAVAAVPGDLSRLAADRGAVGALGTVVRAYAMGGAIYTGLEAVSNGVPILREPKVRSARRTMLLLAGVPALLITVILAGYLAYDVRPSPGVPMNAALFERAAAQLVGGGLAGRLAVAVPLLAEAALLVMAAQTGFVDGPRILGALATDRYLPRRLSRLNGRLAPAAGILVVATVALAATALTGAALEPLIAVFVTSVFVTFSISQWAMLRHALRRRLLHAPWRADAALHALALTLCAVILAGTAARWRAGAAVTLLLVAAAVALALAIRRRYEAVARAAEAAAGQASPPVVPEERQAEVVGAGTLIGRDVPIAVLVLGDRTALARVGLAWLARLTAGLGGVILAGATLLDAEAVQGEEHLRARERQRRRQLEALAEEVRRSGLPVAIALRRGADALETTASLIADLMRRRPAPSVVVGFRSTPEGAAVDPLLRDDDLSVRLQTRLQREGIPMVVVSVPLDA
ncbi:amino acid permease-associated region [Anaeromyxobacter dehalogenans 2CP-1]|uniref:Amino acid permease-associated region n=1 Tax=Anaeromyxobacter dehalogenans (strain ATCC BAA-258 / DSM 21875 / 2CP-1) TaxID=455488 RepID=B8JF32_ANAD2|nr:APC family permease [Anaeromyxobacter dehalogenans]ACL64389.1 amino acid permease-associated region [Anaeromyxobacter dehalogenans 2CP-1]